MTNKVLIIAVWFGLVTGLIEGVLFLVVQKLGWVMGVWLEIAWISTIFDMLLFIIVGLGLILVSQFFKPLSNIRLFVFVFAFLMFFDWLALLLLNKGYVNNIAVLILAVGLALQLVYWFRKHEEGAIHFWRMSLPWVSAVAILVLVGIQAGLWLRERIAIADLPSVSPNSPNVLVIVIDALRADHLSSYEYERLTSPVLDDIASQGVLFENAFATSSYTFPTHVSLLTGLFPSEHGARWTATQALNNGPYPTISETLRSRGYRTGAFSANTFWFTREYGFGRGFIHFEDYFHSIEDMVLRTVYGRAIEKYVLHRLGFEDIPARKSAVDINSSLIRWIDRDREKPFFAFVNYMDVHDPYLPPQPYRNKFSNSENPGGILNWRLGREDIELTSEQLQGEIDAYDGAIAFVDDQIGQLLNEIRERDLSENTLIIITSDHGEAFGEHGTFLHGKSLYLEEIQVPLILWLPDYVPAGLRVVKPVTNAWIPATILDLLGESNQNIFPGSSLGQFWQDPEDNQDDIVIYSEIEQLPWVPEKYPVHHGAIRSIVSSEWHYIENEALGVELYDWIRDRQESRNLIENQEIQSTVDRFKRTIEQQIILQSD